MKLLDRLERQFGHLAIPHLTIIIVIGQSLGFIVGMADPQRISNWMLEADLVKQGEYWRLVTFPFVPPGFNILVVFAIYIFYMMGTVLEANWGTFRYNLYLLIAYCSTVGIAFLDPLQAATVSFIGLSVYLAFAWLYPNFELLFLFLIPVKIKYFALLAWLGILVSIIFGDWWTRLSAVASVFNFLLFFGTDIASRVYYGRRRMASRAQQLKASKKPFHECAVCGVTEKIDRKMEFRICSQCDGTHEYCMEHLQDHQHVVDTAS